MNHSAEDAARIREMQRKQVERSVLGSCLLDNSAIDVAMGIVKPDHFFYEENTKVYRAMLGLHDQGKACDILTVAEALDAQKELEEIGGPPYLLECLESVPHAVHVKYYAEIVRDNWRGRSLRSVGEELLQFGERADSVDEALMQAERRIHEAMEASLQANSQSIGDILTEAVTGGFKKKRGVEIGFDYFDFLTDGLQPGQVVVLAARPGMGKSAMALNIAQNVCESGEAVLFVSLEMPRLDLSVRMLQRVTGLSRRQINSGQMQYGEQILNAAAMLGPLKLIISDDVGLNAIQISAMARLAKRKQKIVLLIIDYLQLIEPEDRRVNREQQVSTICRRVKKLAMSCKLPVILLSQLNRDSDKRIGQRPLLCDLRESGAIEQDADIVAFVHRPGYYDSTKDQKAAELIIGKHRNGEKGVAELEWTPETATFRSKRANEF